VGKEKDITDKWLEEQLTATHLTNNAAQIMQLKDPKVAFPDQMFPTVSSPYKEMTDFYELLQPEEKEQEDAEIEARMEANVAAVEATWEDEEEANEGEETEDPENEQEYKVKISKYSMIFKVHTKLTVKTTKIGKGAAKFSDKVFNALPWYGLERHLKNQSIEPKIDNLWNALFAEGTPTPLQKLMIKVNENKATTPVNKNLSKIFFDELSLESGALDAAGTNALEILDRLEGHVEELRDMKADKGINIPESVIEKVASMVDQVKDLQKNRRSQ
jgi:hypothetical protein